MKAVLQMEFAYLWSTNAASLATFFVMYVFLTQTLQTPTMVSVLCAMEPLLVLFTFMNADMANGWGRYRAALPLSRSSTYMPVMVWPPPSKIPPKAFTVVLPLCCQI